MQRQIPTHTPSDCGHAPQFEPQDGGIGKLFRDYGEEYLRVFKASEMEIRLIRSIRICKTPHMGGTQYKCKGCGQSKYVYYGCGNSRCPKCQGIKRMQWQDRIANRLHHCPYVHMTFTLPQELRSIAKVNPTQIYGILMRSSWEALKVCCADSDNVGALPGAIMVLHTFGSDLKYHVHVHALVSFGGIDKHGNWKWPKRNKKIVPYRQIRTEFRKIFLSKLKLVYTQLHTRISYEELHKEMMSKSWCVNNQPPTSDTKIITEYLGKYICRIGVSKTRFLYDPDNKNVHLQYKDYRNQGSAQDKPPMAIRHLKPLVAIQMILQHCLPKYFQKCRYYGLHASASARKYEDQIPQKIKNKGQTIRTIMQIISIMMGVKAEFCTHCGSEYISISIKPDRKWIHTWLHIPTHNKDPVTSYRKYHHKSPNDYVHNGKSILNRTEKNPKHHRRHSQKLRPYKTYLLT